MRYKNLVVRRSAFVPEYLDRGVNALVAIRIAGHVVSTLISGPSIDLVPEEIAGLVVRDGKDVVAGSFDHIAIEVDASRVGARPTYAKWLASARRDGNAFGSAFITSCSCAQMWKPYKPACSRERRCRT